MLEQFHFLRPLWLLSLVPIAALFLMVRYAADDTRAWRKVIDPHLLAHLRVPSSGGSRVRPIHLVTAILTLCALAAAGPTWEHEVSPFSEDIAPLIIAVDLSNTMNAVDVQPTRLERAKQKITDILTLRQGAKTALIAYAGSAHVVLPPCDDSEVFGSFLAALQSDIMPLEGRNMAAATAAAETLLARSDVPGTILFVTDAVGDGSDALREVAGASDNKVAILVVATANGGALRSSDGSFATESDGRRTVVRMDRAAFEALNDVEGISVVGVTADDADVHALQRRIESNLRAAQQDDISMRWKDNGYTLVIPIALLLLFWFRRGWAVQWGATVLAVVLSGCGGGSNEVRSFADLWWTGDQQGQQAFAAGNYAAAAAQFDDPMWRGVAAYRTGDYSAAVEALAQINTPESYFNQGNAFAHLAELEASLAAYDAALALRPDWQEAMDNRNRIAALIPAEPDADDDRGNGDPSYNPDKIVFDEKGKKGKKGKVEETAYSEEQIAEMWMRRLQTTPAEFLRNKFAIEAAALGSSVQPGGAP